MGKHVYKALGNFAGVRWGELFEADENDPRVKSGLVELVPAREVPSEVAEALAVPPVRAPRADVGRRGPRRAGSG